MKVTVRLFAGAKEAAGTEQIGVDLPPGATIARLREQLANDCPTLAPLLRHVIFAMDAEYANNETVIQADAEIACIPPVSGG